MSKDKCPDCKEKNTNTGRYALYNSDFDTGYCYDCGKHFPIGRIMKDFFNKSKES